MKKYLIALVVIVLIIIVAGAVYLKLNNSLITVPAQVVCTKEAKICPDGSSVGRTGPKCEFEECPFTPDAIDEMADWKTYKNEKYGYEVKYPSDWTVSDSSYTYQNNSSISFRLSAPERVIPQSGGEPASFSMLICKINGIFTDICNTEGKEDILFMYPKKLGDQAVNEVGGISNFILASEEYSTAMKILKTVK
ncbi:MAG: hypothetical protein WC385_00930 [Candidatus Paceibacterota bacterium]|jgi:hypothetical protein